MSALSLDFFKTSETDMKAFVTLVAECTRQGLAFCVFTHTGDPNIICLEFTGGI
jgi:hypothetical protein